LATFGAVRLRDLERRVGDIGEWSSSLPLGYRHAVIGAFRQVLDAAVRWGMASSNPVRALGSNPEPRRQEVQPFTLDEIDRIAEELGEWGSAVVFASETGLRPSEWLALTWDDVGFREGVVHVRRTFAKSVPKDYGKTIRSRRRVPLSARAAHALHETPRRLDTPLVFANRGGGHVDLNNWRRREWSPGLDAAGVTQRGPYALRHTFASFALDAGIPIFELARYMGCGVRVLDRTYGHLVPGSEERARAKLDERTRRERQAASG
jgi:integrase